MSNPLSMEHHRFFPAPMNGQRLGRAVSDVCTEIDKIGKELEAMATIKDEEVEQAECECCGLKEDCTQHYITQIKGCFSGKWVCGLCSEAVKETHRQLMMKKTSSSSSIAIQEAITTHRDFCQEFNTTTRLNPKLSFTCAMRNIAKRSSHNRNYANHASLPSNIYRSSSCVPRIDL